MPTHAPPDVANVHMHYFGRFHCEPRKTHCQDTVSTIVFFECLQCELPSINGKHRLVNVNFQWNGLKAGSTLRSSRAVPHPSTNRALRRLTSEVGRDPVHSTRYGRQRMYCFLILHPCITSTHLVQDASPLVALPDPQTSRPTA